MSEGAAAEGGSIVSDAAAAAADGAGEGEGEGKTGQTGDAGDGGQAGGDAGKAGDGDAGDKGGDKGAAGDGAPESYTDFTLPEGVELDPLLVDTAVPFFKEANLSQEQAQGMVDAFQKVRESEAEAFIEKRAAEDKALREELGDQYEPTQKRISGMLARFSKEVGAEVTAQVAKLLHDDYGIGSNPGLVKLLDFAAKGLAIEDNVSGEGGQQGGGKGDKLSDADAARELYGDSMYNEDGSLKNP